MSSQDATGGERGSRLFFPFLFFFVFFCFFCLFLFIFVHFCFFLFFLFFLFFSVFFCIKNVFFRRKNVIGDSRCFLEDPVNSLMDMRSTQLRTSNASTPFLMWKNGGSLCTPRFHSNFFAFLCRSAFLRCTEILCFAAKFNLKQLDKNGKTSRNIV